MNRHRGKPSVPQISAKDIRDYREFRSLTQQELGYKMGVTRQTIAAWENGESTPTVAQMFRLAGELDVSADLLFGYSSSELPLLFRADDPSVLVSELKAVLTKRADDYATVERALGFVPAVPESRPMEGYEPGLVEEVARDVRTWLGVEEGPLHDGIALLEDKGLKVLLYPLPDEVSGFSAYTDESGAVIFVNQAHPVERQVFTAFHEVAHLVFHRQDYRRPSLKGKQDNPREKAANHLAGAVLLPKEALVRELRSYRGRWLPEKILGDIKMRYQVSMRTILIRAAQLGIISYVYVMAWSYDPDSFSELAAITKLSRKTIAWSGRPGQGAAGSHRRRSPSRNSPSLARSGKPSSLDSRSR